MNRNERRRSVQPDGWEERVAEYLREHPDFFVRHPGIVEHLQVPHQCGEAISLVEYQIAVLRDENRRLRHRLHELSGCARENEELSQRLHRLTLSLIACEQVDDIFATLQQAMCEDFLADAAAIRVFASPRAPEDQGLGEFLGADPSARAIFARLLEGGRPVCGRLRPAQRELLFGERSAEIGSGALVPIGEAPCYGVLAIGSRDPHRYHPGMGTMFLRNLAELVGRVLTPHVATT